MRPGEEVASESARRVRVVISECVDNAERQAAERIAAAQREAEEIVGRARAEALSIRDRAEAAATRRAEQAEAETMEWIEEVHLQIQELGKTLAKGSPSGAKDASLRDPGQAPRSAHRSNGNGHRPNGNGHRSNGNGQTRSLKERFRRIVGDEEEFPRPDDDWIIAELTAGRR